MYKLDKKFKFSENVIFFNENELTHISYIKHNLVIYQLKKKSLKIGLISISLNNGIAIDISVIKIVN